MARRAIWWLLVSLSAPAMAQTVPPLADAPVLAQSIAKGSLLAEADFVREPRPLSQLRGAVEPRDAAGREATRNLPAGAVVRAGDLQREQLVRRGEPVAIRIHSGALTIVATGRALGGGAGGDLVRVVSLSTNRTLDAIVEGPGAVGVDP